MSNIEKLILETKKEFEIINITDKIKSIVYNFKIKEGSALIYSRHTTLALKINEDELLLRKDIMNFMEALIPYNKEYNHDNLNLRPDCPPDEPKNARGHLMCMFFEASQTVPIIDYEMQFGKWQSLFAIETSGPRKRELLIQGYKL